MIRGTATHLLADALLIPSFHQSEKWRFLWVESHSPFTLIQQHTNTHSQKFACALACSSHTNKLTRFVCLLLNYSSIRVMNLDIRHYSLLKFLYIILLNKVTFLSIFKTNNVRLYCIGLENLTTRNLLIRLQMKRWWLWTVGCVIC